MLKSKTRPRNTKSRSSMGGSTHRTQKIPYQHYIQTTKCKHGHLEWTEESIKSAKLTGTASIINCNMLVKNNKLEQILGNCIMHQVINEPKHLTEKSETLMDIIATSSLDLISHAKVRGPSLSNQCNIEIIFLSDSQKTP